MKFVLSMLFASACATFYRVAEPIPDTYIIKFKEGTSEAVIADHKHLAMSNSAIVEREWSFGNFQGYSASITDKSLLSKIEQLPEVEWVEEDGVVRASSTSPEAACTSQTGATWGITRTTEQGPDPTGLYKYTDLADGSGVTVYVIDTGIYIQNVEFGGRATWGTNTVGDGQNTDGNGHGTHCAGTIGGTTYGMAKKVRLVAVKVLSASGSGSNAGVIQGIDWAVKNGKGTPAVGSMSLGGSENKAMNTAVANAIEQGLIMVVAAGNEKVSACTKSPASTPTAITVAASDSKDTIASFSNYGKCVTLYAPGVAITSAWIGSPTSINTISGTSMACPHVAGQVAKFLETDPTAKGAVAKAWIVSKALSGLIKSNPFETPNLLLFGDCQSFGGLSNKTITLDKRY